MRCKLKPSSLYLSFRGREAGTLLNHSSNLRLPQPGNWSQRLTASYATHKDLRRPECYGERMNQPDHVYMSHRVRTALKHSWNTAKLAAIVQNFGVFCAFFVASLSVLIQLNYEENIILLNLHISSKYQKLIQYISC